MMNPGPREQRYRSILFEQYLECFAEAYRTWDDAFPLRPGQRQHALDAMKSFARQMRNTP